MLRTILSLAALFAMLAPPVMADTIMDGNSYFEIDDIPFNRNSDSANGSFHPNGGGTGPTIYETWWWYRLPGDLDENVFYDPILETYEGNTATFGWSFATFDATLQFILIDGTQPLLIQNMEITNTSGQDLEIDLFHYLDARLGPDHMNDTAELFGPAKIHVVSDDGVPGLVYEGVGDARWIVTNNDSRYDVEKLFRDDQPTDFDNSGLPFALEDGNFNAGMQWTLFIPAGGTASATANISTNPEPGSVILVGAVLAAAVWQQRRRRRLKASA